mmetsp:Transcript_22440/g.62500  ORF Transcript_22440/g.62500 Transcript_22440/m.62500 type:complete len:83 (+) Transcript_22440:2712-2960(+)
MLRGHSSIAARQSWLNNADVVRIVGIRFSFFRIQDNETILTTLKASAVWYFYLLLASRRMLRSENDKCARMRPGWLGLDGKG